MGAKQFRKSQIQKGENTCIWCQKTMSLTEITVEHMLPKFLGGSNNGDNLRLACRNCNFRRGAIVALIYLDYQQLVANAAARPTKRRRYINHYAARLRWAMPHIALWEERHRQAGLQLLHDPWHFLRTNHPELAQEVEQAFHHPEVIEPVRLRPRFLWLKKFRKKIVQRYRSWRRKCASETKRIYRYWKWRCGFQYEGKRRLKLKQLIFGDRSHPCFWCGVSLQSKTALVDLKVPARLGGREQGENIVLSCFTCKRERHELIRLVYDHSKEVERNSRLAPHRQKRYVNNYKRSIKLHTESLLRWQELHQRQQIPVSLDPDESLAKLKAG